MKRQGIRRLRTGVNNLDGVLGGGLPVNSISVLAGPPGSGKTIIAQQIVFHNATPERPALYLSTLSEPVAKQLLYVSQFDYFDPKAIGSSVHMVDLGGILRADGIEKASDELLAQVRKVRPSLVVVDSFKAFNDLSESLENTRKFSYQMAVNLMAWEATGLLLGEYSPAEHDTNPLFSIVDGFLSMSHRMESGEMQRFLQVNKMRGIEHNSDPHSFAIGSQGIEVYAPRVTIKRDPEADSQSGSPRRKIGIPGLDNLLGEGVPNGSTVLVSGVPGTGKTVLLLEFLYRGALAGEKGVLFSFEETEERLRATAKGLGWDLEKQIERGMVEIVFTPQPDIRVERNVHMIAEKAAAMKATRIAIDSVSVLLHKVVSPQITQEKIFQLASVVQNEGAIGFFAADVPYASGLLSRLGVEETIVDGVIVLSAEEEGLKRSRYLEVYKLRNTEHANGRFRMKIKVGGIELRTRGRKPKASTKPEDSKHPPRRRA